MGIRATGSYIGGGGFYPAGSGGGSLDPDAEAYLTAAGISDATEIAAVNQLVLDLKGTGSTTNNSDIWTQSYILYPISPTSLSAASYNLKDPTQNQITWFNSPTHSATGVQGNGTNQYGTTGFNAFVSAAQDDFSLTVCVNTNQARNEISFGAFNFDGASTYSYTRLATRWSGGQRFVGCTSNLAGVQKGSTTDCVGVNTISRTGSTNEVFYFNGSNSGSSAVSSTRHANVQLMVLAEAQEATGLPSNHSSKEVDFAAATMGLDANEAQDLYDAINKYNVALSR